MKLRPLGRSGLSIAPIVFGGNVLGWTVGEAEGFRLLDAFVDAGFNAIDTADSYMRHVEGNSGGESETIIGNWLAANPGKRDKVVLFTKVGSDMGEGKGGLSRRWIAQAAEDSLSRLKTDRIDLYFSHRPDPETGHAETLGAYAELIEAGKVNAIGASNFSREQMTEALELAGKEGLPRYEVIQPGYNLYDRADFETGLADLVRREGLGVVTYYSLAAGFLTGKYRDPADLEGKARARRVGNYMNARGEAVLTALDTIARKRATTPAAVALAWLIAQDTVTAPIASATSVDQLETFSKAVALDLDAEDLEILGEAGK